MARQAIYRVLAQWTTFLVFLVNDQRDAQILFYVFISIYNSVHVSSTSCSSSGETNCINTASGNSHSRDLCTTNIEWQLPEVVLTQLVSPDDEHDVLETCRNKYIEKNLFITLVIYQESLYDARSTKCKIPGLMIRQGTDERLYTYLSSRTMQNELYTYCISRETCIWIKILETTLHLLLEVDVDVVFAKTRDSSVTGLFMMEVVYSDVCLIM
jgi:hypothetical protein